MKYNEALKSSECKTVIKNKNNFSIIILYTSIV